jgi:hypothetical protein
MKRDEMRGVCSSHEGDGKYIKTYIKPLREDFIWDN